MTTLYEAWTQCEGNRQKSSLYIQAKCKDKTKRKGVRAWMTMKDLTERFGATGAQALVDHKLADKELAESEVRYHPSAPKVDSHALARN